MRRESLSTQSPTIEPMVQWFFYVGASALCGFLSSDYPTDHSLPGVCNAVSVRTSTTTLSESTSQERDDLSETFRNGERNQASMVLTGLFIIAPTDIGALRRGWGINHKYTLAVGTI